MYIKNYSSVSADFWSSMYIEYHELKKHLNLLETSKTINDLNYHMMDSLFQKIGLLLKKLAILNSRDEIKHEIKTIDSCFKQLEEIPKFELPKLKSAMDLDFEQALRLIKTLVISDQTKKRNCAQNHQLSTKVKTSNIVFARFKGINDKTNEAEKFLQKIKSTYKLNEFSENQLFKIGKETTNLSNNRESNVLEKIKSMKRVVRIEHKVNSPKSKFYINQQQFLTNLKNNIRSKINTFEQAN